MKLKTAGIVFIAMLLVMLLYGCNLIKNDNDKTYEEINIINNEPMVIKWDSFAPFTFFSEKGGIDPADRKIAKILNERFNIRLQTYIFDSYYLIQMYAKDYWDYGYNRVIKEQIRDNTLPDIFDTHDNADFLIESGLVKAIPWDMIETYAPRYAAVMNDEQLLKKENMVNGNGTYVLFGLEKAPEILSTFSVYRYDWLEEGHITPPGNITQISDYIYFTDTAFTQDEFLKAIDVFSNRSDVTDVGFVAYALMSIGNDTLMGMFGLNWDNVYEDGKPLLTAASRGFYSFLIFMESCIESGSLSTEKFYAGDANTRNVGWWTTNINEIYNLVLYANHCATSGIYYLSEMKLLLAPPEMNYNGMQGAHSQLPGDLNVKKTFVLNANISDEKLAKILEIFETYHSIRNYMS